ncbi:MULTISPECIES: DUF6491 family protein [unclassified Marinimicrobium]|jgi:hypothetical protein|uniref:DUF6491 family protein n=1 Tax=unclassified Marinimicrobium TaxID=2632100 RepID=UPI00257D558E|nr:MULTISPECIES: DUF6491 family protein [unclassified Marinimicrobium]|tara:strand:+ start:222 stop:662 length:441 start_codon:yes stop_codon:yes gene_type:complete
MKLWKLCATAPLLAALSACTTTGESVPSFYDVLAETAGQNGRACVRHSDIRGYGVLDHDVISIDGRRNYYLATVMPGCNALDTSPSALFEERFSEVCGGGMHKVYAGGDHCTIRQMYEFENREAAFEAHRNAVERYDALREAAEQD